MHALNPLVLKDHPNIVYLHTWLNQSPESVQHNSRWAALHTISKNCQYDKLANSKLANSLKTAEDCIEMYFGTPQFLSCLENRFMQSQKPKVKKKKSHACKTEDATMVVFTTSRRLQSQITQRSAPLWKFWTVPKFSLAKKHNRQLVTWTVKDCKPGKSEFLEELFRGEKLWRWALPQTLNKGKSGKPTSGT